MSAAYYYFKPSGKWKYEGQGESLPMPLPRGQNLTHDYVRKLNRGTMPGITGDGKCFILVIIDHDSWPRLIPAQQECFT